ncbi:MAG: SEC59/DGK1/VTE5 family protein [Spirochaetes bacterium]|nr:SEC59/DGK1/VTE5 family protein [Spirochaetota bacterium]
MRRAEFAEKPAREEGGTILPFIFPKGRTTRRELSIELTRKSIHLLIAFVPFIASISRSLIVALLISGCTAYAVFETLRFNGISVPIVSDLTARAARLRDAGKFVQGPITLGVGALLSVLFFGESTAAIAIYVLAFGDGLSSLVGKAFGQLKLPFTKGKSLAGSITCFLVSFLSTFAVSGLALPSLVVAAVSTLVEAAPTKDWDNIVLPLAAGLTATLLGL